MQVFIHCNFFCQEYKFTYLITVKPLLSDKIKLSEKITLIEQRETLDTDGNIDDETVNNDVKIAEIFSRFFSNAVIDLKIPDFHGAVPLADNISHPIFRAILKYANHPSLIAIKDFLLFQMYLLLMLKKKLENLIQEKQLKIPTSQLEY